MGRYVNNNKVNLNAEGGSYDYDDAVSEIAGLVNVGTRTDGKFYLADVLSSEKINRWALHKPIRSSKASNIGESELMSAKCGLSPVKVSKILAASVGMPNHSYTKDQCVAEIAEWGYLQPRGVVENQFTEWYRLRDMQLYNHIAEAPDNNWMQMDISLDLLNKLKDVDVTENITGDYGKSYNFKLDTKYNGSSYYGGLYDSFSMRIGTGSGENIGGNSNMEIPIKYIASLDGAWRIALAIWLPNYGTNGGWYFFSSRMTIEQFFKDNLGTGEYRQIFPDLATNPYGCLRIAEYIATQGNYATFDVVPLLIKNLGNVKNNVGSKLYFSLEAVNGVTEAYCMPSGASAVPFVIGTPPMTLYYKVSRTYESGAIKIFLENTDTTQHTFGYNLTRIVDGSKTTTTGSVTLSGGEKRQISAVANAPGNGIDLKVTSQDGVAIN